MQPYTPYVRPVPPFPPYAPPVVTNFGPEPLERIASALERIATSLESNKPKWRDARG